MEAANPSLSASRAQVFQDISSEQYHGERIHTSSSQLVRMLQTPAHYQHHLMCAGEEESDLMKLGTAVHCALLEPKQFPNRYVLAPRKYNRTLKVDKTEIALLEAAYPNKILVAPTEALTLSNTVKGIRQHRMAASLLSGAGESELSIFWRDAQTGLNLKVRIDRFAHSGLGHTMVEVKTTDNASPGHFSRKIVDMDYDMRAVMCTDAIEQAYGIQAQIVWIVIERETGFVTTYKPSPEMIRRAKKRYEEARLALAKAKSLNQWPSYQSGETIEAIELPRWIK